MPDTDDSRSDHERQLDAIIHWYYEAVELGDPPDQDAVIAEHPEFAAELREFFANARLLEGVALHEEVAPDEETKTYISRNAIGDEYKGRYRLDRILGEGAFGRVYLGYDELIKREVAIKVPNKDRLKKPEDAEAYLTEARIVASLDHPHIVPVFDVGRTQDGSIYLVSQFIEGITLADRIKAGSLSERDAAQLLATVARALQHAHDRRLIHRDVKPANILLQTQTGKAYVTDFGLAIREQDYLQENIIAGTASYMSPEQARGEGHRLDGRSDIFSMGIILYEILTGKKPFRGSSPLETLHEVISKELKRPRDIRESIPVELERICLKSLSKLTSDRYATAAAVADDLEHWLKPPAAGNQTHVVAHVVPKGLRSFDAADADFFLDLLPGPRNRDGLPESVAFWKQRIEQTDPGQTFNVGLIYGPSGCGKSSLVKAGLLPHLSQDVVAIYVEATADETEARILRGLRKGLPEFPESRGLADTLTTLRRGQGRKVVIIIDQFEQWLHANQGNADAELVQALRQCDGGRVQAIVMVRDDFSVAASRFMRALDTRIVEGQNYALIDLFDIDHAASVLTKFGQAFGKLPSNAVDFSDDQRTFVNEVATGLAQDNKVVPIRLSLFAEMVKGKPWTIATLQQVGGTAGVGVNFLEVTFSSPQGNPDHRRHAVAARSVFRSLLPELGTDIKGHMRSEAALLEASGYAERLNDFGDLLRILDGELRLITPTDPEGKDEGGRTKDEERTNPTAVDSSFTLHPSSFRYYQLTHDYLVPSLREWLTRKQKESRRGRAELKLDDRTSIWNARRENKQLPTLGEWLSIRRLTDSKRWTEPQRSMMQRAARMHGINWGSLLLVVLLVGTGIQQWNSSVREKNLHEQTLTSVEALQNNLGPSVPFNLEKLGTLPKRLVLPELQTRFASAENARHKLSLAFALANYEQLEAEYLASQIETVADADTGNYMMALQANPTASLASLKAEALKWIEKPSWRGKVKLAIAALGLGGTELAMDVCTFENRPDPEQRTLFIDEFRRWNLDLKVVFAAVQDCDSPALRSGICLAVGQVRGDVFADTDKEAWKSLASQWFVGRADTSTHGAAGWLLRQWHVPLPEIPNRGEIIPERDWFVNSVGSTMLRIPPVTPALAARPDPLETYRQQLVQLESIDADVLEKKTEYRESRAIASFHTGKLEDALHDLDALVTAASAERQPKILQYRTLTLARLGRGDEAKSSLTAYLEASDSASNKTYMQIQVPAWLGDIAEATRQLKAAITLGGGDQVALYNIARAAALCAQATAQRDGDQSKKFTDQSFALLQRLTKFGYVNVDHLSQDPDFANLHGDARFASILAEMRTLGEFWIADREVTRGQFEQCMNEAEYFAAEKRGDGRGVDPYISPTTDHPAQQVSWYAAVMYCNWLSRKEGWTMCYEPTGTKWKSGYSGIDYNEWRIVPGGAGYRLPSEKEWEYACRAGTLTENLSGNDATLLVDYGQLYPMGLTSVCGEKLPNAWGLHDVQGNVSEWCWDLFYSTSGPLDHFVYRPIGSHRVLRGGAWNLAAAHCGSAYRLQLFPTGIAFSVGFRLALSPAGVAAERARDTSAEPVGAGMEGTRR